MGDFGVDTAVEGGDGRYRANLSDSWQIWGPEGGYLTAVAIRAAGAESLFARPVSFAGHFVRMAAFGEVDIAVESIRATKRAQSLRVRVEQGGQGVMEALVWTADHLHGLDHAAMTMPEAPSPDEVRPWEEYLPGGEAPFPFWRNFDVRPVLPPAELWEHATDPRCLAWMRLRTPTPLEDPFVEAGRLLTVADSFMFPSATLAHEGVFPYVAPSLDLVMSLHDTAPPSDWLLVDARAPLSAHAIVAGQAVVWSQDGRLLGTAMQQMLQRP